MTVLGRAQDAANWIIERERIRLRKEAGDPLPWTKDPILAAYRFCNVHREHDAVTRWLNTNWRPFYAHENYIKATALARLVNWPPTLSAMGFPTTWDEARMVGVIESRLGKAWGSAYIVSTNGKPINKALYVVKHVSGQVAGSLAYRKNYRSLKSLHTALQTVSGLGSFLAAQIVADVKNTAGHQLAQADDWWIWAAPGPGSLRGIRRYFHGKGLPDHDFLVSLHVMRLEVEPLLPSWISPMCAQDWQNCCCELDKYWRTQSGEGRPKAYYSPNPDFSNGLSGRPH